jgi:phosphatidylinositol glycan class M
MLVQTFAFVTFNKVCTSQYFLWYLIFLPIYLPSSRIISQPLVGFGALAAWVAGQAYWLFEGYQLEFLGEQAFVPGLWYAGMVFFAVNCIILSVLIDDVGGTESRVKENQKSKLT